MTLSCFNLFIIPYSQIVQAPSHFFNIVRSAICVQNYAFIFGWGENWSKNYKLSGDENYDGSKNDLSNTPLKECGINWQ